MKIIRLTTKEYCRLNWIYDQSVSVSLIYGCFFYFYVMTFILMWWAHLCERVVLLVEWFILYSNGWACWNGSEKISGKGIFFSVSDINSMSQWNKNIIRKLNILRLQTLYQLSINVKTLSRLMKCICNIDMPSCFEDWRFNPDFVLVTKLLYYNTIIFKMCQN